MSFVVKMNPFSGILCVPFYYIWLLIIASWILAFIEVIWIVSTNKWKDNICKEREFLEIKINTEIRAQFKIQLNTILINCEKLPNEIISLIMDMLPEINETWKSYKSSYEKVINLKIKLLSWTAFIYPCIRAIVTFIVFMIIMIHYAYWHTANPQLSNWDKYNALIISLFYMPNFKGRGTHSMLSIPHFQLFRNNKDSTQTIDDVGDRVALFGVIMDTLFGIFFTIISFESGYSFPLFISGIFIYIPTTILGLIVGFVLFGAIFVCGMQFMVNEDLTIISAILFTTSLGGMWFFIVIIICTMELYSGNTWSKAYRIGFLAEYCNESDYFQLNKWNEYPMHIQFLIFSWFVF
eukprot:268419_1